MKIDPEDILSKYMETKSVRATARALNTSPQRIKYHLRRKGIDTNTTKSTARPESEVYKDYDQKKAFISVKSLDVRTLEDALAVAEVDMNVWEVDRYIINSWEVTLGAHATNTGVPETFTNWQVKAWLKPKKKEDPIVQGILELVKEMPRFETPKYEHVIEATGYALEMALYDAHFGKLAWGKETMQGDYDIEKASDAYLRAAAKNLEFSAPFKPEKIFFILGNDLMHIENIWGVTPVGQKRLDMDSRFPKIYKEAKAAVLKALYMCAEVAPVEVLWIPGNHDIHASFFMSDIVMEHFRDTDRVIVDNTPPWRKARLWGNLLVGFTHDAGTSSSRGAVTVNMLPQFWPELWGKSKFREWHTGHKHKKQETRFMPTQTVGGVIIRQMPTLSTIDAWHYQESYVDAVPGGESFVWSKENGVVAHYTAYV